MKVIVLSLALTVLPLVASAQSPRFEDYPVSEVFIGKPAAPILTKDSRMFRTRLREGARQGPNFAGHFTVITWGCGAQCYQAVVVDAKTGRVHFPPFGSVWVGMGGFTDDNPAFRINSKLLVIRGARNEEGGGTYYYVFDRNRFRLVRAIEDESILR